MKIGTARRALLLLAFCAARGALATDTELFQLENAECRLGFHREGGALVHFEFKDQGLNPFAWALPVEAMPPNNRLGAPFRGHFLCLGRWGAPTEGERKAGVPHNGEAANRRWRGRSPSRNPSLALEMEVEAPLEHWQVRRSVRLARTGAFAEVTETVQNALATGRFTALVQHATLGGSFLEPEVRIDTNATEGFNQAEPTPADPSRPYRWPQGLGAKGEALELSSCEAKEAYVSTHIFETELAWVTALNRKKGLLVGYLWRRTDYPWLHLWHGLKDGKVWARGLEFATTGLGDTLEPAARARASFRGYGHFIFLDAGASLRTRYHCFLLRVSQDYAQTLEITETKPRTFQLTYREAGESKTCELPSLEEQE